MTRRIRSLPSLVRTIVLMTLLAPPAACQEQPQNLNVYYRSPFTMSAEYYSWSPFADYSRDYNVFEVASSLRFPLPNRPAVQPLLRVGYVNYDSLDDALPEKWDHFYVLAGAGVGLSSRFSKNFEVGAEVAASYGQSYYGNLVDEPVGYSVALGSAGVRLSLVPSFNLSIDVMPQVRYLQAFSDLNDFNGVSIAIGFGAAYRFGQDPDAPQAEIRSIRFVEDNVPALFAALQSYYVNDSFGTVTIENSDDRAVEEVDVLFYQAGFMDSPTPAGRVDRLEPGESVDVPLLASFNEEVFDVEGVTPLTGEIIVRYTRGGRAAEQRQSVTYDLHDKTALTWTDDRKMGSFITPADSAVRNYTSYVRQQARDALLDGVSEQFQVAMLAYHALEEIGIVYQVDPTSPFTEMQGNTAVVDSVSLPRDTLRRLTGDCDDLTALYATMLETVGIETAFVTTPGHIYVAFDTGVAARNFEQINPNRELLFIVGDNVWMPVEVTMLGRGSFVDAWRYGADEWTRVDAGSRGLYRTREVQTTFRPVGLRQTDLGLQYGDMDTVLENFRRDLAVASDAVLSDARATAREEQNKRAYNKLGILAAQWGRYDMARDAFNTAAVLDPDFVSPRVNLGAVAFLREQYGEARNAFESARDAMESARRVRSDTRVTVLLNLSKTYYELGEYDAAQQAFRAAEEIDADAVARYSYLAAAGDGSARASDAASGPAILFAEGDE